MKKLNQIIFASLFALFCTQAAAFNFGSLKDSIKEVPGINLSNAKPGSDKDAINTALNLFSNETAEEEISMGKEMSAVILGAAKLHPNQKIQKYVNLVGRNIASQSERPDLPWTFGVLDTSSINAFAAPGGYILISKGLYDQLKSEDELAAVLAHEIAHVVHKHHYNIIKKQSVVELGANYLNRKNSEQATQLAASLAGQLIARGLDKNSEYEADRDGIVLAARAGYDSSAMLAVLDSLELHGKRDRAALSHMFATHPLPSEREQELLKAVNREIEAAAVPGPTAKRINNYR